MTIFRICKSAPKQNWGEIKAKIYWVGYFQKASKYAARQGSLVIYPAKIHYTPRCRSALNWATKAAKRPASIAARISRISSR